MTNSPLSESSIKRSQAFLPVSESFVVEVGDLVDVSLRFLADGSMITWSVQLRGAPNKQSLSTWKSTIIRPDDLTTQSGEALSLSSKGEARLFTLAQVNGERSISEIEDLVCGKFPTLFPAESVIREFVRQTISRHCIAASFKNDFARLNSVSEE